MFEVGFQELVLIAIIGLLVLGPQRLPKVAAEIGKWVGRARRTATQLRRQLEREIELSDLESQTVRPPQPSAPPPPAHTPAANADPSAASSATEGAAVEAPPPAADSPEATAHRPSPQTDDQPQP